MNQSKMMPNLWTPPKLPSRAHAHPQWAWHSNAGSESPGHKRCHTFPFGSLRLSLRARDAHFSRASPTRWSTWGGPLLHNTSPRPRPTINNLEVPQNHAFLTILLEVSEFISASIWGLLGTPAISPYVAANLNAFFAVRESRLCPLFNFRSHNLLGIHRRFNTFVLP